MNFIIIGGTGFIGTHLTILIKQQYSDAHVYNLDIVRPDIPLPAVKVSPLKGGQVLRSVFVECDVRKSIEHLPFTPTSEDVIFNFAAVHRTPGHRIRLILRRIFVVQRMYVLLPKSLG